MSAQRRNDTYDEQRSPRHGRAETSGFGSGSDPKDNDRGLRAQYTDEQRALVKAKYHLCNSPADRKALAREVGIESIQKLYNLASRIKATRGHANSHTEWTDEDERGYDPTQDTNRLYIRDDYATFRFNAEQERYIREHWRHDFIEEIAFMLNCAETTVAYNARRLGLRNVPKYWDVRKVGPWLNLSMRELIALRRRGLELFPCCDARGNTRIILVSTSSLARVMTGAQLWKQLVDRRGADEFFIRDVIESMVELQDGKASWEPNVWVSHGHTCLNPFSESCFGWFFDGYDDKMAGYDLDPRDLAPSQCVESDNWRRGAWRQEPYGDSDDPAEPLAAVSSRARRQDTAGE